MSTGWRSSGGVWPAMRHFADAGDQPSRSVRGIGVADMAQHVHVGAQRLERLLVLDAETLFLVDDDEAQILELDRSD